MNEDLQKSNPEQSMQPPLQPTAPHPERKKAINKKGLILIILLVIILVSLGFYAIQNMQETEKQLPIAEVGNKTIYEEDVQETALEQYQPSAVDQEALSLAFDTVVERFILDEEANKLQIVVSDEEIQERVAQTYLSTEDVPEIVRTNAKYDVLADKITEQVIESRQAYSIEFYIASYDEERTNGFSEGEKEKFEQQRREGETALPEVEQRLKAGEEPAIIAQSIYNKYPALRPVLAVNGYILNSVPSQTVLLSPKLYEYNVENVEMPFFDSIYSMQANEIKRVVNQDGSGGYVIQMKEVNHAQAKTFEEWIAAKKSELVKMYSKMYSSR